jgi:hypothetical protein
MRVRPALCHQCRTFVFAEAVANEVELAAEIRDIFARQFGDPTTAFLKEALARRVKQQMDEYRFAVSIAAQRKSPPRCLKCGAVHPQPIGDAPTKECDYFASPILGDGVNEFCGVFTPEGLRIR